MKHDEFAFFNQQLATMLRDGIPLEGAMKQLVSGMRPGRFRDEIARLEADLGAGCPLDEALSRRDLPELYRRMVAAGARGNDLPGVLTLLADHYRGTGLLWTRLTGLMVYPLIVVVASVGLTTLISVVFGRFASSFLGSLFQVPSFIFFNLWVPPFLLACAAVAAAAAVSIRPWRTWLQWRLPAFREASLAQLASAMALLLKSGTPLPDALALAESVEADSAAGPALSRWRKLIESGQGNPAQWPKSILPFPPLFLWLVRKGGEDLAGGFQKASDLYRARAAHRADLALYGALPVSVLVVGLMIILQLAPLFRGFTWMLNMIGGDF